MGGLHYFSSATVWVNAKLHPATISFAGNIFVAPVNI
jgi:hypothetical protein